MTYTSDVYMFNALEVIATDHNLLAETMRNTAQAACTGESISERSQVLAEALRKIASHGSITWMRRTAADALKGYITATERPKADTEALNVEMHDGEVITLDEYVERHGTPAFGRIPLHGRYTDKPVTSAEVPADVTDEVSDPLTAHWFAHVNDLLRELRETLDIDCDDLDRIEEAVEGLTRRITQAEAAIGALTDRLERTINSTVNSFDAQDNLNILNVEAHKKLSHDLAEAIQEHEYMHHTPASAVGGPFPPLHCDSPTIFLDEDRTTPYQLAADGQVQLLREPVELFADERLPGRCPAAENPHMASRPANPPAPSLHTSYAYVFGGTIWRCPLNHDAEAPCARCMQVMSKPSESVDQVEQDALREEPERVPEPLPEEAPSGPRSDSDGTRWDFQPGDTLDLYFPSDVFGSWPDWHGREIEIIKGNPPALVVFDVQSKSMRKHYLDDDEIKHIVGGLIHNIPLEWWGEQGGSQ